MPDFQCFTDMKPPKRKLYIYFCMYPGCLFSYLHLNTFFCFVLFCSTAVKNEITCPWCFKKFEQEEYDQAHAPAPVERSIMASSVTAYTSPLPVFRYVVGFSWFLDQVKLWQVANLTVRYFISLSVLSSRPSLLPFLPSNCVHANRLFWEHYIQTNSSQY